MIPKHLRVVRNELSGWRELALELVMRVDEGSAPGMVDAATAGKAKAAARPRRRKMTAELLAEVAALYKDNLGERSTWNVIAQRFGVEKQTAGRYVMHARKAGYLPGHTRGIEEGVRHDETSKRRRHRAAKSQRNLGSAAVSPTPRPAASSG